MKTKFAIVSCALALASCVSVSSQLDWAYAQPALLSGATPLSSSGLSCTAHSSSDYLKLRRFAVPVQASKDLAAAYRKKGEQLYFRHSAFAAIKWLDKAIALDPLDAESHLLKGAALVSMYKFDEGKASFNRSIEISPQSGKAYCNRAHALYWSAKSQNNSTNQKLLRLALDDWNKGIQNNTTWTVVYYHRALTRDMMGDRKGALEDLNEDIRRNPEHADAYFVRSSMVKSSASMVSDLETAARLEPQSITFLTRLAMAQLLAGRNADALLTYNKLVSLRPGDDFYLGRGLIKFDLKDNVGALYDFDQSIKLGGDCFKIRGIARARNGDHLGAMIDQYGATIVRFSSQFRNFLNDLLSLKALP